MVSPTVTSITLPTSVLCHNLSVLIDIGRDITCPLLTVVPELRIESREMTIKYDNIFCPIHKLLLSVQAVAWHILEPG